MTDTRILLLHPQDNVYIVCRSLSGGERLTTPDGEMTVSEAVELGHKIARRDTARGEKIIKYGAPIGSSLRNLRRGEHVHLHNMRSDYIAGHLRSGRMENDSVGGHE